MILKLFDGDMFEISDTSTNLTIVMEDNDPMVILAAVQELTDANLTCYELITQHETIVCERGHVISTTIEHTETGWQTISVLKQLPGTDYKAVSDQLANQLTDIRGQLDEANDKIAERDEALAILLGEEVE